MSRAGRRRAARRRPRRRARRTVVIGLIAALASIVLILAMVLAGRSPQPQPFRLPTPGGATPTAEIRPEERQRLEAILDEVRETESR